MLSATAEAAAAGVAAGTPRPPPNDGFPVHGQVPQPSTPDDLAAAIFRRMDRSVDPFTDFYAYACETVTPETPTLATMEAASAAYIYPLPLFAAPDTHPRRQPVPRVHG